MTAPRVRTAALLTTILAATPAVSPRAGDPGAAWRTDPVLAALDTEIGRALTGLSLDGHAPPYFISAIVNDYRIESVSAEGGALVGSSLQTDRLAEVVVRVGDADADNGRFIRLGRYPGLAGPEWPESDDPLDLRRALWLTLDEAYKDAVEDLARKRAVLAQRAREELDPLPDFVPLAEPSRVFQTITTDPFPRARWEATAKRLSLEIADLPRLFRTEVELGATRRVVRYVDSAGNVARHERVLYSVEVRARAQADDGMKLSDSLGLYYARPEDLPDDATLSEAVRRVGASLSARATAPLVTEPYLGPVLFEDEAAAMLLLTLVGNSAAVAPEPVFEDPRMAQAFSRFTTPSPWAKRIGKRVAARFIDFRDNPNLAVDGDLALIGSYATDDEGVPPAAVSLIEAGILRAHLATRTPTRHAPATTGHGRLPPGVLSFFATSRPVPGVLVVDSREEGVSRDDVRARFREMLDEEDLEYGYVVQRVRNAAVDPPSGDDGSDARANGEPSPLGEPLEVVAVARDGSVHVVRGLDWGKFDTRLLRDLVMVSSDAAGRGAFNLLVPLPGMGSLGATTASVIGPRSVLVEELELVPLAGPYPALPALPSPPPAPTSRGARRGGS